MNNYSELFSAVRGISPISSALGKIDIRDVKQGGFIEIQNETYMVSELFRYLEVKWKSFNKKKNEYWVTELQLLNVITGQKTFIEWEFDDELEMGQTVSEVKLSNITYQSDPVTRSDLYDIAENEHGSVKHEGIEFHYVEDDSWAALFYRNDSDEPLPVRMYEFMSKSGLFLTIELWEDDDSKPEREAFISKELAIDSVAVIQINQHKPQA
jgi:hypothetical protein